jgi:hypothetical protein
LLSIKYDSDGIWRINCIDKGQARYSKVEGTDEATNYSDVVTLEWDMPFNWVVCGEGMVKRKGKLNGTT